MFQTSLLLSKCICCFIACRYHPCFKDVYIEAKKRKIFETEMIQNNTENWFIIERSRALKYYAPDHRKYIASVHKKESTETKEFLLINACVNAVLDDQMQLF